MENRLHLDWRDIEIEGNTAKVATRGGSATLITSDRTSRDRIVEIISNRLSLNTGGWKIKPKRWKFGPRKYYGIILEREL